MYVCVATREFALLCQPLARLFGLLAPPLSCPNFAGVELEEQW